MRRSVAIFLSFGLILLIGAISQIFEAFRAAFIEAGVHWIEARTGHTVAELTVEYVAYSAPAAMGVLGGWLIWIAARRHLPHVAPSIGGEPRPISAEVRRAQKVKRWLSPLRAAKKFGSRKAIAHFNAKDLEAGRLQRAMWDAQTAIQKPSGTRGGSYRSSPPPGYIFTGTPAKKEDELKASFRDVQEAYKTADEFRTYALNDLAEELREQLQTGALVARGFILPAANKDAGVILPAQWSLLILDIEKETAANAHGLDFSGVTIGTTKRWF
jgi:hypothetical protein